VDDWSSRRLVSGRLVKRTIGYWTIGQMDNWSSGQLVSGQLVKRIVDQGKSRNQQRLDTTIGDIGPYTDE